MALNNVLMSGQLTYGQEVLDFEKDFLQYTSAKYVYALNSATSSLHLAFLAGGIKASDVVVIPANTYTATASSAKYVGAEIVLCDIDPKTGLISIEHLKKLLRIHEIKAVVAVNIAGQSCDLSALNQLKKEHSFLLIEDAAHGFFLKHKDRFLGDICDFTIFSFHPNKVLGSIEGGVIAFNQEEYNAPLSLLKSTGISREKVSLAWDYDVSSLGYKYAMNSMCAALLQVRLRKAESDFLKRKKIVENYISLFKKYKISSVDVLEAKETNFHLFRIFAERRNELSKYLFDNGIETSVHYKPLHLHSYWKNQCLANSDLNNAEEYYQKVLSLPLYPSLSVDDQEKIVLEIQRFYLR